jgi:hypothetical protein
MYPIHIQYQIIGPQKVDDARLTSLLSAFERDRQHLAATTAAAAAAATVITIAVSTPSSPLTRAPVNLKHLAFGYWVDWEKVDQTMCEAFAQEVERVDSGLAALEVEVDLRLMFDCSFACTDLVFSQT